MSEHPIFARFYDRLTAGSERAGLGEMRRELLASASGRVLELGTGTGHNLPYYTDAVTELVMTEPEPNMARQLRERVAREPNAVGKLSVVEISAEGLPFEDLSFDAPDRADKHVVIDADLVRQRLDELARDEDLSRFIL